MSKFKVAKLLFKSDTGAILVLVILFISLLLIFVGITVDVGITYMSEGSLQSAADGAALAAVRNIEISNSVASQSAQAVFLTNFNQYGSRIVTLDPQEISDNLQVTIQPADGANPNAWAEVRTSGRIRTLLLGNTLSIYSFPVKVSSRAVRSNAVIDIVIDLSSSIVLNSAENELVSSVDEFIKHFNNNTDLVGLMQYGITSTDLVPISTGFNSTITNKLSEISTVSYKGWTAMDTAIMNSGERIDIAKQLAQGQVKGVMVFFTDGLANAFQAEMNCDIPSYTSGLENTSVVIARNMDLFKVTDGTLAGRLYYEEDPPPPHGGCKIEDTCGAGLHPFPFNPNKGCIADQSYACALQEEAERRALEAATLIRASGTNIFAIGLGSGALDACGKPSVNPDFLNAISGGTGNNFAIATDVNQLKELFNEVASHILIQMTQ